MIRFLASEPHYAEHLRPVVAEIAARGGDVTLTERAERSPVALTVVASWKDYQNTHGPVVFFEHGAGFTYRGNHHSYAGGPGRDRVVLFVNPNADVEARNRDAYPDARHVIAGSPKLDTLAALPAPTRDPVVAFSWHWDCRVAPETRTAFPHYRDTLAALPNEWAPLGHAHPRAWSTLRPFYRRHGWKTAETFDEVARDAHVYVCDTSSTIYEFAALDRPVVVLNAPHYRRDVEHGLRFWRDIPGIQVDNPEDLGDAIREALTADTWSETRREITGRVYPHLGQATIRAADAILGLL